MARHYRNNQAIERSLKKLTSKAMLKKLASGKYAIWALSALAIIVTNFFIRPNASTTETIFAANTEIPCTLDRVIDGDTVIGNCEHKTVRIRLTGIDAPEMGQENWGQKSKEYLMKLLNRDFTLVAQGADTYQRQLGILWVGDKDINLEMIRQGMAVAYRSKETPAPYFAAEKQAKKSKKGIWAVKGAQQDPKKWRRYHQ